VPSSFVWYENRARVFTDYAPQRAHDLAAAEAAGVAARGVGGRGSGTLARDVSVPKRLGPLRSLIGSVSLVYARIENFGGVIRAKRHRVLYIVGNRIGARGQTSRSRGSKITAVAVQVEHRGKHYLEPAVPLYAARFTEHLRALMPK
jgi:hypothetical protein